MQRRNRMRHIIQALQFLTTLPFPDTGLWQENDYRHMAFYPLAGFLIGLILATVDYLLFSLVPIHVLAVLLLAVSFFLTGGIHADGLADTADGFFSGKSCEGILLAMKDSRLGTHGVMALILVYLLKFALLIALLPSLRWWVLIMMPVFGRLALVFGSYRTNYARPKGLGNFYIGKITIREVLIASCIALIGTIQLPLAWSYFICMPIFVLWYTHIMHKKIGGMTGDTLGALMELTETLFLLWMVIGFGGS